MSEAEAVRDLHRIVDRRLDQRIGHAQPLEIVRGDVIEVSAGSLSARLDGADSPTLGIVYGPGQSPSAGDSIVVLRRRDGFLLLLMVLTSTES